MMSALLAASAVAGIGAPSAAGQAVPWGYSCTPAAAGVARTSATCGATLVDGQAVPPPNAPVAVKAAIAAANHIAGRPYVWGGGHRSWTTQWL